MRSRAARRRALGAMLLVTTLLPIGTVRAAFEDDVAAALTAAELLRGARSVIAVNQNRINDPNIGDKGLTGDVVVREAIQNVIKTTGDDPRQVDPNSDKGRLLAAMTVAIQEVMASNQGTINQLGVGFKGFVPAVFGRMVTEQFKRAAEGKAQMKVTAPPELVRNRKAVPDAFETAIIRTRFEATDWPKGKVYSEATTLDRRPVTRVLVPEYYGAGCLSCHGTPKGEIDITGYPKEGAAEGELGGVISITLFR
jgi:Protein of unknown function (DUF3365)